MFTSGKTQRPGGVMHDGGQSLAKWSMDSWFRTKYSLISYQVWIVKSAHRLMKVAIFLEQNGCEGFAWQPTQNLTGRICFKIFTFDCILSNGEMKLAIAKTANAWYSDMDEHVGSGVSNFLYIYGVLLILAASISLLDHSVTDKTIKFIYLFIFRFLLLQLWIETSKKRCHVDCWNEKTTTKRMKFSLLSNVKKDNLI